MGDLYPDLSYDEWGTVVIQRKIKGTDLGFAVSQVESFLRSGQVETEAGTMVDIEAGSICVHGDGEHAIELAMAVRQALLDFGAEIEPVSASTSLTYFAREMFPVPHLNMPANRARSIHGSGLSISLPRMGRYSNEVAERQGRSAGGSASVPGLLRGPRTPAGFTCLGWESYTRSR